MPTKKTGPTNTKVVYLKDSAHSTKVYTRNGPGSKFKLSGWNGKPPRKPRSK